MRSQAGISTINLLLIITTLAIAAIALNEYVKKNRAEELAAKEKAHIEKIYDTCRAAVKGLARFSSKATFTKISHVQAEDGKNTQVLGNVDLMNGFGAMIPNVFTCTVNPLSYSLVGEPFVMIEGSTPEDLAREVRQGSRP